MKHVSIGVMCALTSLLFYGMYTRTTGHPLQFMFAGVIICSVLASLACAVYTHGDKAAQEEKEGKLRDEMFERGQQNACQKRENKMLADELNKMRATSQNDIESEVSKLATTLMLERMRNYTDSKADSLSAMRCREAAYTLLTGKLDRDVTNNTHSGPISGV